MCLKNKIIYTKIDIQKFDKHTKKLINNSKTQKMKKKSEIFQKAHYYSNNLSMLYVYPLSNVIKINKIILKGYQPLLFF